MLKIDNLSKTYSGGKRAVDNLTLHVRPGDIFGFIGHNGAGKTTTIRAVTGVLAFDEGAVTVDGVSLRENPVECKRRMAYIPDTPSLYEYLTGMQYISFICDMYGVAQEARAPRVRAYADAFELTPNLGDLIGSYSHGMRQKLSIIAALAHEPRLLVLDEPFVGLDPKAAHTLKQLMHTHCKEGGAIFFSTHVLEVAQSLCNRIAIIKNGRLAASGEMQTVLGDRSLEELFMELAEQ